MSSHRVTICTGGQSGVDRSSLDIAQELGIPYEGWCPAGGWAEDLTEPPGLLALYPNLRETVESEVEYRTIRNVERSGAVLTLTRQDALSPGTSLAVSRAHELGLPEITILVDDPRAMDSLRHFLASLPHGTVVDINGPRASEAPGIYEQVKQLLGDALKELQQMPIDSLDELGLELVTHWGLVDGEDPYVTGVYIPDDQERAFCFQRRGSSSLQQALETHKSMMSLWNDPSWGVCLTCQAAGQDNAGGGWIIDQQYYCRNMTQGDHEPNICSECEIDVCCKAHDSELEE